MFSIENIGVRWKKGSLYVTITRLKYRGDIDKHELQYGNAIEPKGTTEVFPEDMLPAVFALSL